MTKKIRTTEAIFQPIRDSGTALPRIDPARIPEALGAEDSAEALTEALAPVTLLALREELLRRLQSSGGRPALAGTTRRAKIPLRDEEWEKLEELATAMASPGFAPSAGQVASVLLTLSLHSVASRIASGQSSPLARDLQNLSKRLI
ncbi:MAG: hypothetical protein ACRELG_12060 [Gemmataceae bacterium]